VRDRQRVRIIAAEPLVPVSVKLACKVVAAAGVFAFYQVAGEPTGARSPDRRSRRGRRQQGSPRPEPRTAAAASAGRRACRIAWVRRCTWIPRWSIRANADLLSWARVFQVIRLSVKRPMRVLMSAAHLESCGLGEPR
jgi:hypothetical protein